VDARDADDPECAGVRRRLARMLAPTPAQRAHVAECRRCRTAQTRLLRASQHAAAFALVPGPGSHVLNALSAAVPGFGASTAAVSAASAATKAGVATKVALAATTAAVAVTAVHPLRSAVTHAILHHAPAPAIAAPPARPAAKVAHAPGTAPVPTRPAPSAGGGIAGGQGTPTHHAAKGRQTAAHGKSRAKHGKAREEHGKSAAGHGKAGAVHGRSASAPGHTKAPGSHAATGRGAGKGHPGHGHSHPHGHPGGRHRGKG
jgi:hypothetical protein